MPNRILRDWTDSDRVNQLTTEGERFFTRLIMKVDDYGRFYADPRRLRSACYPLKDSIRDTDVSRWLAECEKAGLVCCYEATGGRYLCIENFGQRLRQMKERFPAPPAMPEEKTTIPNLSVKRPSIDRHLTAPFVSVSDSVSQQGNGGVGERERPPRFPVTIDDAIRQCSISCGHIPKEFVMHCHDKALARNCCDSRDIPIADFPAYVRAQWKYEQDRVGRQEAQDAARGKPYQKKIETPLERACRQALGKVRDI